MTRGTDTIYYHATILHILKQVDFFKMRGARSMEYKFSQRTDEVFKKLVIKDLRGGGMSVNEKIIEKLIEYQNKKEELLDWPYHILLESIIDDVIEIVKEVAE